MSAGEIGRDYAERRADDFHHGQLGGLALEFDDNAGLREVTASELTAIEARIAERQTCLLSLELVDDIAVDDTVPRDESDFTCVSPDELQTLTQEARNK